MRRRAAFCGLIGLAAALSGSWFLGYQAALRQAEEELPAKLQTVRTFYGEITRIDGDMFYVTGLDVNDINFRGRFTFRAEEGTELTWVNTDMELSEFDPGDTIAVTFTGLIQEISPANVLDVIRIELLDDEK